MAINSTVSDPSANSYLSVIEADAYFAGRLKSDLWDALTTAQKERALVTATRRLETEKFGSIKTLKTQALEWPRVGVTDRSGYIISSTVVPTMLKYAACEYVWHLLDERMLDDQDMLNFNDWSVGSIKVTINSGERDQLPLEVRKYLRAIGEGAWAGDKKSATTMVR